MSIDIGAWNTEQRLTLLTDKKRGTPKHILDGIEALDRDILILPEAFQEQPAAGVNERLTDMGYEWVDVRNDDKGREREHAGARPYTRILSRLAIKNFTVERFGGLRNTPIIEVEDSDSLTTVRVMGMYLRDEAEWIRDIQMDGMIDYLKKAPKKPTAAGGDFNATHLDWRAAVIGSSVMRMVARHIPHEHIRYVAERCTDMATGRVLATLEQETEMRDLDTKNQPTTTAKMRGALEVLPSIRLAQIDHIYVTPDISASGVKVAKDGGSDHRAVSATISA